MFIHLLKQILRTSLMFQVQKIDDFLNSYLWKEFLPSFDPVMLQPKGHQKHEGKLMKNEGFQVLQP